MISLFLSCKRAALSLHLPLQLLACRIWPALSLVGVHETRHFQSACMGGRLLASALGCLCSGPKATRTLTSAYTRTPAVVTARSLHSHGIRTPALVKGTRTGCVAFDSKKILLLQQQQQRQNPLHRQLLRVQATSSASQPKDVQRKVSHILVKPSREDLLDEIEDRLAGGEEFRMLAGEMSECESRVHGGSVGWIERGQTAPTFEQAVFEADLGELVRAETHFGLHLIKVEGERLQAGITQMSVSQLANILQDSQKVSEVQLIDVREEVEARVSSLPRFQLKPLSRMRQWGPSLTRELDTAKHTIVLCHHGMRSQQAAEYFQSLGFGQVSNVEGGIHAYSLKVDPTVPFY